MLSALLMFAGATDGLNVIATFSDPAASRESLVAQQIERPTGISAEAFAAELVEAEEELRSWSPQDATNSSPGSKPAWKARHAGDGREVIVYFDPTARDVCLIRRPRGGLSDVHYQAVRWCAASLGFSLSVKRQPPVG